MKSHEQLMEIRCSADDRIAHAAHETIQDGANRYRRLQVLKAGAIHRLAASLEAGR